MTVAVVHLVSTLFMAGVIVFVQIVHYPLMARVGRDDYPRYQTLHASRTGWVVGPPMLAEMASALWLAGLPAAPADRTPALIGVGLLAVIWLSTALLQVPAHGRLAAGFDEAVHRRLVRTNWIRTVAWLVRVPVALALMP